jgi:hypothetical protein
MQKAKTTHEKMRCWRDILGTQIYLAIHDTSLGASDALNGVDWRFPRSRPRFLGYVART